MAAPPDKGENPSMDDILASIRRILNDDAAPPAPPSDEVLHLDASMLAPQPPPTPILPESSAEPVPMPPRAASAELVAPAAAAAAASSVGGLVRHLAAERATQVSRGGPTIEDLVRKEIRPVLKEWLDTHLPPLVERLVQAEIERVVNRSAQGG